MGGLFSKSTTFDKTNFWINRLLIGTVYKLWGKYNKHDIDTYYIHDYFIEYVGGFIKREIKQFTEADITSPKSLVILALQDYAKGLNDKRLDSAILSNITDSLSESEIDAILLRPVVPNQTDPKAGLKVFRIYDDLLDKIETLGHPIDNDKVKSEIEKLKGQLNKYFDDNYKNEYPKYVQLYEAQRKQQEPELAKIHEKIVSTFKSALQITYNDPAFKEVFDKYRKAVAKSGGSDLNITNLSPILLLALCVVLVLLMICQNFDMIHSVILGVVVYLVLYSYFR